METKLLLSNSAEELSTLEYQFEEIYDKKFGKIFHLPQVKSVVCELTQPYVPIEKFRKIFELVGQVITDYKAERFIFDKRQLKAFHQPSMEWYFVEWKQEMYQHGMRVHRKILPPEDWFEQAVKAGRAQIIKKYPNIVVNELDIQYRNSLLACIKE